MAFTDLTVDDIEQLDPFMRAVVLARLEWVAMARPAQLPPPGDWFGWAIIAGRGYGKGLSLDTVVPTPQGFKFMGHLKTGDLVFGPNGEPIKILAHEPYTPTSMYRLSFEGGLEVEADGNHLWYAKTTRQADWEGKVLDTDTIAFGADQFSVPHAIKASASPFYRRWARLLRIEKIQPKTVRCLTVDHPSALYAITRGHLLTHNTRPGAEETWYYAASAEGRRCAVVAPTQSDLKKTCFEGESGLLARCPPGVVQKYNKSDLELHLTNGSIIQGFSAEKPERLRGPQFHFAWCDELAAWGSQINKNGEHGVADPARMKATWDMLMFGLRLPPFPRVLITSTPKPYPLVREIVKRKDIVKSHGSTKDNKANLAPSFYQQILQYEGTALGKQEIYAELLNPEDAGIFKRSNFRLWPAGTPLPRFHYVIMSWDTAFTDKTNNDPTACSVWGVFTDPSGGSSVMLLDVWNEHINADDLLERAVEEYKSEYGAPAEDPWLQYKPVIPYLKPKEQRGRRPDIMLIEEKGSGIQLIQALSKQRIPVKAYNPGNLGKVSRAHAVSWLVARGKVWVPESDDKNRAGQPRKWVEPFLEQVCTFPMAEHDDMVDTFTQALALLRDQGWLNHVYNEDQDVVEEDDDHPRQPRRHVNPYAV